jgi:phosphomannomutase
MHRLIEATEGETVDAVEGVRVRRGDEWAAAIPDADRPCFHVVAGSTDRGRARLLVEEFRDRITAWRKEAA